MRVGDLNKRITIQYPTKVADVTTWADGATVWAAIWPISASEVVQANAAVMLISHRIRIRYRSVMKANFRIVYAGRNFNIVSVIDVGMNHRWMDILCKEASS